MVQQRSQSRRQTSPRRLIRDTASGPTRQRTARLRRLWASRLMLLGGAVAAMGLIVMVYQDDGRATEMMDEAISLSSVHTQPAAVRLESMTHRKPTPVWKHFAAASERLPGQPMIAIVIDDMGIDARRSRQVIELPAPLTTSFLPYGKHSAELAQLARAGGHELMVHLPMQPRGADADPGPHALKVAMSAEEIDRQLNWNLGRFGAYVGVNNHMGSAFTASTEGMREVLAQLDRRGLLFLDSMTTGTTATQAAGEDLTLPILERDVFLDNVPQERAIWLQLKLLEQTAERQGHAIAIGHPYDATIRALRAWLPRARERGFAIVPVSALVEGVPDTKLAQR